MNRVSIITDFARTSQDVEGPFDIFIADNENKMFLCFLWFISSNRDKAYSLCGSNIYIHMYATNELVINSNIQYIPVIIILKCLCRKRK